MARRGPRARRQLKDARAADHALAMCNALVHAACPITLWVGDLARTERLLTRIDDHVAAHAMTIWSAMAKCLRGEWQLQRGDPSGLPILHCALDQLAQTGLRMRRPAHLGSLAEGLAAHGQLAAASATIGEAIEASERSGELWCLPELLRIQAGVLRLTNSVDIAGAREHYARALDCARRQGALSWELRIAIDIAQLRDNAAGAQDLQLLASTYQRFTEGFETRDLQRARTLIASAGSASA